jgi:hypothetical protein
LPILIKASVEEKPAQEANTDLGVGGKHLAPKSALDYVRSFLTLTVISGVLAFGGLLGLRIADLGVIMPESPFVPQIQVSIVDGTNTGIAQSVGDELKDAGWNIVSTSNLGDIDPGSPEAVSTLIFITEEGFRDEAEGLAARFEGSIIVVSDQFPDAVTLVIGTEYLD